MSTKYPEQRKSKNSNNIYPNLLQNKSSNNKLSFTNALKNNTQKQKLSNSNISKKHPNKINISEKSGKNIDNHNNNIEKESNEEEEITNPINKEQEINIKNISIDLSDEYFQKNKKLHNVDSFKNIEFLLPKNNNVNENISINTDKKMERNRRYINQGSYDFDGNLNNNNIYGYDYSDKKK